MKCLSAESMGIVYKMFCVVNFNGCVNIWQIHHNYNLILLLWLGNQQNDRNYPIYIYSMADVVLKVSCKEQKAWIRLHRWAGSNQLVHLCSLIRACVGSRCNKTDFLAIHIFLCRHSQQFFALDPSNSAVRMWGPPNVCHPLTDSVDTYEQFQ